jgi:uncharacterized protein YutE (UPF0331/DUF86 family)
MEWLAFIGTMTGHLGWPVAVLVLGFMFRKEVRALLAKMKSLKTPGGIEAAFELEAREIAIEAKKVQQQPLPAAKPAIEQTPTSVEAAPRERMDLSQIQEFRRKRSGRKEATDHVLTERPSAMVLDSWNEVEAHLREIMADHDTHCVASAEDAISMLTSEYNVIDRETANVLHGLLKLRNQVAHVEFEPDRAAAVSYAKSAQAMIHRLEALQNEHWEHRKIGDGIESP